MESKFKITGETGPLRNDRVFCSEQQSCRSYLSREIYSEGTYRTYTALHESTVPLVINKKQCLDQTDFFRIRILFLDTNPDSDSVFSAPDPIRLSNFPLKTMRVAVCLPGWRSSDPPCQSPRLWVD